MTTDITPREAIRALYHEGNLSITERARIRNIALAALDQLEAVGKERDELKVALEYTVGLLPGLAGASNQPDNAVYTIMATKGEIMKARALRQSTKGGGDV